jgi:cytochrome c biogenesis factor
MFNFFWTSFQYLPLFFSVWFFIFWLLSNLQSYPLPVLLNLLLLFGYTFESFDTLVLSYHADCFDLDNSFVNLLLSNNLNKYHPYLFYMSVALGGGLVLSGFLNRFNFLTFALNSAIRYYRRYSTVTLILNLTSLFMGSWWALQEGTWGGWWNWDASEVLGLLVTVGVLAHLHTIYSVISTTQVQDKLILFSFITLLGYAFIQLNFDLVSHNFGSKFFFFFNNNLFLLELMLVTLFRLWLSTLKTYTLQSHVTSLFPLSGHSNQFLVEGWWLVLASFLVLTGLLGSSFLPLLNYFIWSYFGINSFNFHPFRPLLVVIVSLSLLLVFTERSFIGRSTSLVVWWSEIVNPLVGSLSLLVHVGTFVPTLHTLFSLLSLSNLYSYDFSFIQWYNYGYFQELLFSEAATFTKQTSYVCDSFWVENSTMYTTNYSTDSISWNVYSSANSTSLQTFLLQYSVLTFFNFYNLSSGWTNSTLFIELNYLNNLFEIWTTLTLYTFGRFYFCRNSVRTTY